MAPRQRACGTGSNGARRPEQLRKVEFRGVVTASMVYDKIPIIDSFRYVDEDTVIGAMDNKENPAAEGTYYFYLTRFPKDEGART